MIDASKTKPFGFQAFFPGPGLGGRCIPIDPFYLTWKAREHDLSTRFIELAGEINTGMPYFVLQRVNEALNQRGKSLKGARVLVLGMAYKKDVDDKREPPALKIIALLQEKGAQVSYHDPHVPPCRGLRQYPDWDLTSVPLSEEVLREADCVLLVTDHSAYDYGWIAAKARLIVDARNAFRGLGERAHLPGLRGAARRERARGPGRVVARQVLEFARLWGSAPALCQRPPVSLFLLLGQQLSTQLKIWVPELVSPSILFCSSGRPVTKRPFGRRCRAAAI